MVHGVGGTRGMVVPGHGADPIGAPWYGSGSSPDPLFRPNDHFSVNFGQNDHFVKIGSSWVQLGPVVASRVQWWPVGSSGGPVGSSGGPVETPRCTLSRDTAVYPQ